MSDARSPDLPSLKVIRPGNRVPKSDIPREACSSLDAFTICPQLHAFGYEMGLKPTERKEALILGSLIHVGLAYRYGLRMTPRPEWLVYPTPQAPSGRDAIWMIGHEDRDLAEKALKIFDAYEAYYYQPVLEPLLVEHQLEAVFTIDGRPVRYTLRIDLLARDHSAEGNGALTLADHKCVTADTVISTNSGPVRVRDLVGVPAWKACAIDGNKLRWVAALTPRSNGVQDVYSLRVRGGIVAEYGWNHPVLTRHGFVRIADLRQGDQVAVAARLPDVMDAPVPDALLPVAGMLISDGRLPGAQVIYTKGYKPFREYFTSCLRELGLRAGRGGGEKRYRIIPRKGVKVACVALAHKSLPMRALYAMGLERVGSAAKRLPQALLNLSRRQVGLLLGGFWSGDGAMYVVKERKAGKLVAEKVRIVYGSRSYVLCCDVRHLFNQLGIIATVTSSSVLYKGDRRPYHFTTVVGRESKRKFLELVHTGFIRRPGGRKIAQRLLELLDRSEAPPAGSKNPELDGDILWNTVESVLFVGKKPTFDIEVPGPATFVADGLVTHNSAYKLTKWVGHNYRADREMLTGLALCRAAGYNVERVMINAIQKGTKERPEPQFQRYGVPISETAYGRLAAETEFWLRRMRDIKVTHPNPEDRPRAYASCMRKFGLCDFWSVCADGPQNLVQFTRKW